MDNLKTILTAKTRQIAGLKDQYAADLESMPLAEAESRSKPMIKQLQREISSEVSDGAMPCVDCGGQPTGVFIPDPVFTDGTKVPKDVTRKIDSFQISCVPCLRKSKDKDRYVARGRRKEEAHAEWAETHGGK